MEQQVWSILHARQSTLRPRVAVPLQESHAPRMGVFPGAARVHHGRFNVLVQWHGFQPNASGFVPLSIAEFSL